MLSELLYSAKVSGYCEILYSPQWIYGNTKYIVNNVLKHVAISFSDVFSWNLEYICWKSMYIILETWCEDGVTWWPNYKSDERINRAILK